MRRYETITIVDTDLSDQDRALFFEKLKDLISRQGGFLIMLDDWGVKKLAYEIKKKPHGYYIRLDYCGTGILVNEMERFFRIDDRVLKYMTVLLDKNVDIETIKQEAVKAENEDDKPDKDVLAQNDESDAGLNPSDLPESIENETTENETTENETTENETTESGTTETKSNEEE